MQALRRLATNVFFTRGGQATLASTAVGLVASFQIEADAKDFFHYTFKTTKNPDAIVDFYSTEEFLQILGIFPFATSAILAGVVWDESAEMTNTVYNTMRISFDLTEKEEQIDGQDVVTFFNKRERFLQYIPFTQILLWDQVQNYGYRRLTDGTIEVSHQGESFYGPWPVRLLVGLHAQYVIWATEKHINSELFGSEDLEAVEHQRANIPAHVVSQWLAALGKSQEEAIAKSKLSGKGSEHQEETLKSLKKLQRRQTSISIERTPGQQGVLSGNVRVKVEDPADQKVIRDALKNLKDVDGDEKAASQLATLINHKEATGLVRTSTASSTSTRSLFGSSKPKEAASPASKKGDAPTVDVPKTETLNYGWESTEKYKGAFAARKAPVNRQPSSTPDEMALWRTEARSLRLIELFEEAGESIKARPESCRVRLPDGLDFEDVIEKATHRACVTAWEAYTACKANRKGSHEKCNGWWLRYKHCLDSSAPHIVLAALEAVASHDPDPNIVRLRN